MRFLWHSLRGLWDTWDPVNRFNNTNCFAIVIPYDCPKSIP